MVQKGGMVPCGSRIGPMRADGDKADVAVVVSTALVVLEKVKSSTDRQTDRETRLLH